jgi:hypothetical protein
MSFEHELRFYVGAPGAGKTELAVRHLRELILASGCPAIILDPIGARNFDPLGLGITEDPGAAIRAVWDEGRNVRFMPSVKEHYDAVFAAARRRGRAIILVDELANVISPWSITPGISLVFRAHRHLQVTVLCTTQYVGDFPPVLLSVATRAYVFRTAGDRALSRLEQEYGLPPDRVRSLPVPGHFIEWSRKA